MADFETNINKNEAFTFAQPPVGMPMPNFSGMKLPPMDFPFFGGENAPAPVEPKAEPAIAEPNTGSATTEVEEEPTEDTAPEKTEEEKATENSEQEEHEKKKRKRATRKKKEASVEEVEDQQNAKQETKHDVITMEVNPDLSIPDIIGQLNLLPDNNFAKAKADIAELMSKIQVEKDMDKATILIMNQRIDELDDLISSRYAAAKAAYNNFCNEKDGFLPMTIERNKRIANEKGVKHYILAGINAAIEYPLPNGSKVNLFQAAWALRYEAEFFEDTARQLETKRRLVKSQSDALAAKA